MKSYLNKDAVPSIGGRFPLIVLTDSMYPEIQGGDLIICRAVDPQSIQVGDIISFFDPEGSGTSVVTHRVMELAQTEEGEPAFRTKGDVNNAEDQVLVPYEKLVGIYTMRIAGLGNLAMFMQTTPGRVAKYGVVASVAGDLFGAQYTATDGDSITSWTNVNAGTVNGGAAGQMVVAPGTKGGTMTFSVTGTPEVSTNIAFAGPLDKSGATTNFVNTDIVLKEGSYGI